jgi:5-hydroxyisourate hydrolase
MGQLTSHVLDTMHGTPAAGIKIDLYSLAAGRVHVKSMVTNADGRCEQPMLNTDEIESGAWELVFHVGDYFAGKNVAAGDSPFLDEVPVRFGIDDADAHYHVPLLLSPWSYTTYRGS